MPGLLGRLRAGASGLINRGRAAVAGIRSRLAGSRASSGSSGFVP